MLETDLAEGRLTENLVNLLEFQIRRTEVYYADARKGIPMLASGRWGVMSGLEIYQAILHGIRRNHYNVFNRRAGASELGKIELVLRSRWASRR